MSDVIGIILLYVIGSAILISELFLPSHGLLGVIGVGILAYGVYETFSVSHVAGLIGLVSLAILLPTGLVLAVRNWHRMPVGKRLLPGNPDLKEEDRMPVEDLRTLIGQTGEALTLLRPVGTCTFNGRRVECKSEHGMIPRGAKVQAVGLVDRTVSVRPVNPGVSETGNA